MWRSLVFVSLTLSAAAASTDLTVKTVTRIEDLSAKSTGVKRATSAAGQENLFVHGPNLRRESLDSLEPGLRDFRFGKLRWVIIDRCDEGLELVVNPVTHQYIRRKTGAKPRKRSAALRAKVHRKSEVAAQGDQITYTSLNSETEDTGETREIFGLKAHHFITRTSRMPTGGLSPREEIADGWFIQGVLIPRDCSSEGISRSPQAVGAESNPRGERMLGLPVQVTYTANFGKLESDHRTRVFESEVVELSEKPVDPQLFEIPKGYKRVKHFRSESQMGTALK